MISPAFFYQFLQKRGLEFYSGVPDSLLKNLCAYLTHNAEKKNHIIAANEGGSVGLAAGYYLATGNIPVVYMQNSGLGNTVNPLLSLMDKEVYNIPVLLLIGWRGEPEVKDEPQHVKQGKVTIPLLEAMGIRHEIMETEETLLTVQLERSIRFMEETKEPFALVIRKGSFEEYKRPENTLPVYELSREQTIGQIVSHMEDSDIVVSTTGMISRELFEYREATGQGHKRDFLTVGSMGHASQIALGIALNKPERRVFCIDGDGATIMHMGALGIIGSMNPSNYFHIVLNNGAHDSVGGQPTIGFQLDLPQIAQACGYKKVISVENEQALQEALNHLSEQPTPLLLEVKVKKGARKDLGRPTTTPIENKENLMEFLNK